MTDTTESVPSPSQALVGQIKAVLGGLEIGGVLTYAQLTELTGAPRSGPDGWEFALIDAMLELETAEGDRPPVWVQRCGAKIGIVRLSADEFVAEGVARRLKHLRRKARRGSSQGLNLALDPGLSAESKAYLGANMASLAIVASASRKHTGLGRTERVKPTPTSVPDMTGFKPLFADT